MKRAIVAGLDWACTLLDRLWDWPPPLRWIARWLGCPSGLARWSAELDERWHTGVWTEPTEELHDPTPEALTCANCGTRVRWAPGIPDQCPDCSATMRASEEDTDG